MNLSYFRRASLGLLLAIAASTGAGAPGAKPPAELARAGDIESIMAFSDQNPRSDGDVRAYKWLAVAQDFGFRSADAAISDLLEISALRYDDGNLVTGTMHYELGVAYLTAADGLPKDFVKAKQHFRRGLKGVRGVRMDFETDRAKLSGEALQIFESFFPKSAGPRRKR